MNDSQSAALPLFDKTAFLRDSEHVRFAMNAAEIGVWQVDTQTNTVIWDDCCRQLFGLAKDNMLPYEQAIAHIHPDDVQGVNEKVQAALRGERKGIYNATYRTIGADDKHLRWVNFTGSSYFESGQLTWFGGIARDVTEQMTAQQKIEASQQSLLALFDESPVAIATLTAADDLVFETANTFYGQLVGRKPEALIGKPLIQAIPELSGQGFDDILRNVVATGTPFIARELEAQLIRNGRAEIIYVNFVYQPRKHGNKVTGLLAVVTDVTEQVNARRRIEELVDKRTQQLAAAVEELRATNEALAVSNTELIRSNRHLEEFAHAASHDLKEPIRKMHFFTNQLKKQISSYSTDSEARLFNRIENSIERMGHLIDDLLQYSHVSEQPPEMETIDLNETMKRVVEELELSIEERKAKIEIEKLPVIKGFKRQMQQLLQNLLSNALKYSKADVQPQINVTSQEVVESERSYHVISVADNGIGFDLQYEDKIFQMFARLHGKNEYSGTGIGLSIVKKVVENHNGFIRVDSTLDKGSVFHIYLPV